MGLLQLPYWLQAIVSAGGGLGLFIIALLDSSFVPFPTVNDLMLIQLSYGRPVLMPYYAAMTTLGSLGGSLVLYYLGRKGGEAAFHKRAGKRAKRIQHWVSTKGFVSLLIASVLPPPTPFKAAVLAAGAFNMPLRQFVTALLIARSARFYGEGFLAVKYGEDAVRFLGQHKLEVAGGAVAVILAVYLFMRLVLHQTPEAEH
jgi:membrane protein YqaA with SNARE-associated domain